MRVTVGKKNGHIFSKENCTLALTRPLNRKVVWFFYSKNVTASLSMGQQENEQRTKPVFDRTAPAVIK